VGQYVLRRLGANLITLWAILTITFFILHAVPGGPFSAVSEDMSREAADRLEQLYGLDRPVFEQYLRYLGGVVRLDFGPSFVYRGVTVNELIGRAWPTSAQLGGMAIFFAITIGLTLGITAALNHNRWPDKVCLIIAILGITIPNFVIATTLIYIFAVGLQALPPVGWHGPQFYVLPVIALSGGMVAFVSRITRSSMLDVIRQDFVRTARSKGLDEHRVRVVHALKNALIPVLTYAGPMIATVLMGSFVIETIFAVPGVGSEMVLAISNRDYSVVLGLTVMYAFILVSINMIVDISYVVIDPRIRLK